MFNKFIYYTGLFACLGIIISCFLPWTYYNSIQQTFSGFHVIRFPAGNYYGKAGIPITVMATLILIFMITPRLWAKRINLFLGALLLAYTIRTYIIFTSALFKGEVEKYAGIYLIVILSILILICILFPRLNNVEGKKSN